MNLNTLKRGFTKTNPEKGLRHLPGAQKSDHRRHDSIRIKGPYIPKDHHGAGKILGITAFSFAWLCNGILILIAIQWILPFVTEFIMSDLLRNCYIILGFVIHPLVIMADGLRNSDAPWARKSILVFWGGLALFLAIYIPVTIIMSLL